VSGQTVCLATSLPEKKLWFSLSWMQGGRWRWSGCFGENIVLLLLPTFEPQIFQYSDTSANE